MEMEERQYAKMESAGLFVIWETGETIPLPDDCRPRKGSFWDGEDLPLRLLISISSRFLSSIAAVVVERT
jgi:hypothetical protein